LNVGERQHWNIRLVKYLDKFYYASPGEVEVDYCQIESVVLVSQHLARFGWLSCPYVLPKARAIFEREREDLAEQDLPLRTCSGR
jgi:hypothetical protein